jgi:hypothetical protein
VEIAAMDIGTGVLLIGAWIICQLAIGAFLAWAGIDM